MVELGSRYKKVLKMLQEQRVKYNYVIKIPKVPNNVSNVPNNAHTNNV